VLKCGWAFAHLAPYPGLGADMSSVPEVDRAGTRDLLCAVRRECYTAARDEELTLLEVDDARVLEVCRFPKRHWIGYALAASTALAASAAVSCRHPWVLRSLSPARGPDSFEASATKRIFEAVEDGCIDDPVGWMSSGNSTCEDYPLRSWCTSAGSYGKSWDRKAHGSFERYANGGRSAVEACCACGGGLKGGSNSALPSGIIQSMINFGERPQSYKSKGPPSCSWDFQNCTESQCCRGYGMQCYSKDGRWSACKASCTPGIDPFDQDKAPWTCKKLGDRTPGPGSEETCNRVRVGANFWSGKVLHRGDAASAHLCSRECELRDWCGVWAWNETDSSKGLCLLAPRTARSRRLNDGNHPPCRLASADLPAQNCSDSGEDCFSSRCCHAQGEQCYKKDDTSAMCRSSCRKEHGWTCDKFGPRICPACRPPASSRPAIVVPTFERDLCKAVLLMKSITKRDPNHFLGDVHIMWVSLEPSWKYQAQIEEMRKAIVDTGGRQFHLSDFSDFVRQKSQLCLVWDPTGDHCIEHLTGWFAQQALKLKIATVVPSEYYLLLDSKNAFFSDIHEDSFFSKCNQATVRGKFRFQDLPHPHKEWYHASARALGVQASTDIHWPTSITPAVFHKQTVLELLSRIGEDPSPYGICDGPLCKWLAEGKTEFTLYNLFAFSKSDRECIHSFVSPLSEEEEAHVALWRGYPYINLKRCEEVAKGSTKALTFGLQAGCLRRHNMTSAEGKLGDEEEEKLWNTTADCLLRVYKDVGLAGGSAGKLDDEDHEVFTKCIS